MPQRCIIYLYSPHSRHTGLISPEKTDKRLLGMNPADTAYVILIVIRKPANKLNYPLKFHIHTKNIRIPEKSDIPICVINLNT
jgi:hypothetical protein